MPTRIIHPADIKIESVGGMTMTSLGGGGSINIFNIVTSFDIYESIYANVICADFVFADGVGLIMSFPIIGEEKITIEMETPGVEGTTYNFYTTEVVALSDNSDATLRSYVVRAVSAEFHSNMWKQYSHRYLEKYAICVEEAFLRLNPTKKPLEIEKPQGAFDWLVRESRPLQVLDLMKERALAPPNHKSSHYVFFEDKYNFKFVTTEYLAEKYKGDIGGKDPIAGDSKEFWLHNKKWQSSAELPNKKTILAFENISIGSDVDKISSAQLNSTTRSFDIKHGIVKVFCHEEAGYSYIPFDGGGVRPQNTEKWRALYNAKPARRFFLFKDTFRKQDRHEEAIGPRRAYSNLLERNAVKIRIYGRTDITAGMMVRLNLPYVSGFQTKKDEPWVQKYEDPLFGDNYMVVELKHQIAMDTKSKEYSHYMVMVCAKPHHIVKPVPLDDDKE